MKKIYMWAFIVFVCGIFYVTQNDKPQQELHAANGLSTVYFSASAASGGDGSSPEKALSTWEAALAAVPDGGTIELIGIYSHRTPTILPSKSITLKGHEIGAAFYWGDYIEMNGDFTVDQIDFSNNLIGAGSMDAPYRSLYVNGYTFTMTSTAKSNANDGLAGEQRVLIYGGSESGVPIRGRSSIIQLNSGNYSHVFAYGKNHGAVEDGVSLYLDGTATAASVSSDENTPFYVTINQPQRFSDVVGILDGEYGYIEQLTLNARLQATPITKLKNVICNSYFEITYPYTQTIEGNLTLDGNAALILGIDSFSPASLYVKGKISGTGKLSNGFLYGSLRSDDLSSNPTLSFLSGSNEYDFVKKEEAGQLVWKSEKHVSRIYVDETAGSDSNDGTSAAPLQSIPKALEIMKNGCFDTTQPVAITLLSDAAITAPLNIQDSVVMLDGQDTYHIDIVQDALITLSNSELQIEKSKLKFHGTSTHIQVNDNSYLIIATNTTLSGQPNVILHASYMEAGAGEFGTIMQEPMDEFGSEVELGDVTIHGDLKDLYKITTHGRVHVRGRTTTEADLDLSQGQTYIADDDVVIGGAIWGNRMTHRVISLKNGKQIHANQLLGIVSLHIDPTGSPIKEQTYLTLDQAFDPSAGNALVLHGMDQYHIEKAVLTDNITYQIIQNTDPNPEPEPEPEPNPEPDMLTVTFHSMGGSLINAITTEKNKLIAQPSDPMKVGYTFAGWYREQTFVTRWDFTSDKPSQSLTLYAKWIKETAVEEVYEIRLDTDGDGIADTTLTVEKDSQVSLKEPVKKGHAFLGWFLDEALSQTFDPETGNVTSDLKLYAKFEKERYVITLDTSGGDALPLLHIDYQQPLGILPVPKRAGYVFKGWYVNQHGIEILADASMKIERSTVLYAKWECLTSDSTPDVNSKDHTLPQTDPEIHNEDNLQKEGNSTPTGDQKSMRSVIILMIGSAVIMCIFFQRVQRKHRHNPKM